MKTKKPAPLRQKRQKSNRAKRESASVETSKTDEDAAARILPRAIPVLGEVYSLDVVEDLPDDGQCSQLYCTIKINAALLETPHQFKKTLLHEIAHAYVFESGLCEILDGDTQEMVATTFANLLASLYPCEFHDYLFEESSEG